MSHKYYPYSEHICHHVYNKGGCTFCGFHLMKNCVSPVPVPIKQQIQHFDEFVNNKKNHQDILKQGNILVESNGSWFVEVPKPVRQHIHSFVESHNLELHTQCRATLINEEKTRAALGIMMKAKYGPDFDRDLLEKSVQETLEAINTELKPYMLIFTGLEVADNSDLKLTNKACQLDDYILFSEFVRLRGAKVGANVLIAPPLVKDPIRKALKTVQFAFEVLRVSEVALCSCIPRLGSRGHGLWRQGKWNPISVTESSEILRVTRAKYPEKRTSFWPERVHFYHGKYSGPKIETDAQKAAARKRVREIAQEVFAS